jgi:hypothetical protein
MPNFLYRNFFYWSSMFSIAETKELSFLATMLLNEKNHKMQI